METDPWSTPGAPAWSVPWDALSERYDWIERMREVPQDARHHAEGDVWIHTRMVAEAMAADEDFRGLDDAHRRELFGAAVLHDVAKPWCTRVEDDGRITSPGHSPQGAREARRIGWRLGLPFAERERLVGLVLFHQVPYHALSDDRSDAKLMRLSQTTRVEDLVRLARADVLGRRCADQAALVDNVGLFGEYAAELGCLRRPFAFPSALTRVRWFAGRQRDPTWRAHEDTRSEVTVMSGMPGAGKSTWIERDGPECPVISLDAIRRRMKVDPGDEQGQVVAAAKEEAREYLRRGEDFLWDATNLSRSLRKSLLGLLLDYDARVHLVYVEASPDRLREQNRRRTHPVPEAVLDRLLQRWEVPDFTEAHELTFVVDGQTMAAPVVVPDLAG